MPALRWMLGAALGAVLVVTVMIHVDRPLSGWVAGWPEGRRAFALAVTDIGRVHWYLVPAAVGAVVLLVLRRRPGIDAAHRAVLSLWIGRCAFLFAAVAATGLIVQGLKAVFGRARPPLLHDDGIYGFHPFTYYAVDYASFPSNHTATLVAAALAVGGIWPRWRTALLALALVLASFRVWVNMHFASDVVGGAMVAVAVSLLVQRGFARRGWLGLPGAVPGAMVGAEATPTRDANDGRPD